LATPALEGLGATMRYRIGGAPRLVLCTLSMSKEEARLVTHSAALTE